MVIQVPLFLHGFNMSHRFPEILQLGPIDDEPLQSSEIEEVVACVTKESYKRVGLKSSNNLT